LNRENILLSEGGIIKICDFGSSKVLDPAGKNTPYIVSRYYRAPELILCVTKYDCGIDIWGTPPLTISQDVNILVATGCILAELVMREPLFQGKSEGDQLFAIFKTLGTPTKDEIAELKKKVPFDSSLLDEFKAYPRPSWKEKFFYINDYDLLIDLLNQMFRYVPEKRITARDALLHPFFAEIRKVRDPTLV
jgi:glycogen synthase kinase 3 beta